MNANSGGDHEFIQRGDVGGRRVKLVQEMGGWTGRYDRVDFTVGR